MPGKALGPVDKGYESHGRFKQGKVHHTDTLACHLQAGLGEGETGGEGHQ